MKKNLTIKDIAELVADALVEPAAPVKATQRAPEEVIA